MINDINFPTIAGGFLNNVVIKERIPKQVFKGIDMCRLKKVQYLYDNGQHFM